jgi:hypothetical protein
MALHIQHYLEFIQKKTYIGRNASALHKSCMEINNNKVITTL